MEGPHRAHMVDPSNQDVVVDDKWDDASWRCVGIGMTKQSTHTYDSYTCCGAYHRKDNSRKLKSCLCAFEQEDANHYKYCTPLGCGAANGNESSWHCLPCFWSQKNKTKQIY